MVSRRTREMTSFIVMDVLERACEMEKSGVDVIHLEVGEPDFDTPQCIKDALCQALDEGHTHYCHSLGLPELREEIAARWSAIYDGTIDAGELRERIVEMLKTCYDPEIPVDIYELGLIYRIGISEDEKRVEIDMTLTWPDYVIIAIILISTLISLFRGFVREAMSLAMWEALHAYGASLGPSRAPAGPGPLGWNSWYDHWAHVSAADIEALVTRVRGNLVGGDPPLQGLADLGGESSLRAYLPRAFTGTSALLLQLDYLFGFDPLRKLGVPILRDLRLQPVMFLHQNRFAAFVGGRFSERGQPMIDFRTNQGRVFQQANDLVPYH